MFLAPRSRVSYIRPVPVIGRFSLNTQYAEGTWAGPAGLHDLIVVCSLAEVANMSALGLF